MLARVVRRARRANFLDDVIVATTVESADDAIGAECKRLGVPIFRGSEEDVLDRYYRTAKAFEAESVVRITSDCPLIDPEVVEQVVWAFLNEKPDYASNSLVHSYPRGLDTEVMTMETLSRAWREAAEAYQRVHVTPYIYQNPGKFQLLAMVGEADYSGYRWTVDTLEDLSFVRALYARLGNDGNFTWRDVLTLLAQEPDLVELNRHVRQKSLQEG
jgi:spore coat polysaccharide biosynthesis protein SpsF